MNAARKRPGDTHRSEAEALYFGYSLGAFSESNLLSKVRELSNDGKVCRIILNSDDGTTRSKSRCTLVVSSPS